MAFPRTAPHPIAEIGHLVEHSMDSGHHILTVYDDGCSTRGAQSNMQDRSLFRDIDLLAAEHGIDSRLQTGFFRKLKQKLESFVGDSIFRIIQIDAQGFYCQTLAALGIIRKEIAEMCLLDALIVIFESFPGWAFDGRFSRDWFDACCHIHFPFVSSGYLKRSQREGEAATHRLVPTVEIRR